MPPLAPRQRPPSAYCPESSRGLAAASRGLAAASRGLLAATLALAVAGCASSGTTPAPQPESTVIRGARQTLAVVTQPENDERVDSLPIPASRLFQAIPRVFAELNMRAGTVDAAAFSVATLPTQFRRVLDGERLSHFLSCGVTAMGNNADLYAVTLRVQSWAVPAGDGHSALHTLVRATARPSDNGSGSSVTCASNGRLEGKIRTALVLKAMATP